MLKNIVKLEFQVAEKIYQFICDNDSPLEHVKEALFQCQKLVGQMEDNAKAQIEAKKEEEEISKENSDGDQQ